MQGRLNEPLRDNLDHSMLCVTAKDLGIMNNDFDHKDTLSTSFCDNGIVVFCVISKLICIEGSREQMLEWARESLTRLTRH